MDKREGQGKEQEYPAIEYAIDAQGRGLFSKGIVQTSHRHTHA
jgi:hypothetical protein